jgi:hypothetical protein
LTLAKLDQHQVAFAALMMVAIKDMDFGAGNLPVTKVRAFFQAHGLKGWAKTLFPVFPHVRHIIARKLLTPR